MPLQDWKEIFDMMGSELWNIRDTPLLENHIKNYLASHPSCINQSPLIGTTRVLLLTRSIWEKVPVTKFARMRHLS